MEDLRKCEDSTTVPSLLPSFCHSPLSLSSDVGKHAILRLINDRRPDGAELPLHKTTERIEGGREKANSLYYLAFPRLSNNANGSNSGEQHQLRNIN